MSFAIVSDSAGDFSAAQVKEMDVAIGTLSFTIDGKTYQNYPDHREMPIKEFYQRLRNGSTATTAAVNIQQFIEIFEEILKRGDDILYLGFSTGLSTTYNSGEMAAKELQPKYPERKIITIDTLCASAGQSLMVWFANEQRKAGDSIEQVAAWVEENKLKIIHPVLADDLNHLKRGGRISATSAVLGTMLSIKPIIIVNNEGKLVNVGKGRGRKGGLNSILEMIEKQQRPDGVQHMFINHSDCLEDAEQLADMVRAKFGTEHIEIADIGPVIGAHTGPGTLVSAFMGTARE